MDKQSNFLHIYASVQEVIVMSTSCQSKIDVAESLPARDIYTPKRNAI